MGGKTWSAEEEEVFWTKMMPHSPKRIDDDIENNEEQSWGLIAQKMQTIMGPDARRKYTSLSVFEHYFQNTHFDTQTSPNVGTLSRKYQEHVKAVKAFKEKMVKMEQENEGTSTTCKSAIRKPSSKSFSASRNARARKVAPKPTSNAAGGSNDSPIMLNCQYLTNTLSHGHGPPASRSMVAPTPPNFAAPAPPSFAAPGSLPRPQYYFHQFPANHDCPENVGSEHDGLFVTQAPASWVDSMAPYGYDNRH